MATSDDPYESHMQEKARRSRRRASRQSKFHRVRNRIKKTWGKYSAANNEWLDAAAVRHVDNPAKCSCWMCGHKRKIEGAPIREKKILQEKPEDQLK